MPTLTIRNVPVRVVRSLKAAAAKHGRSMEQEVRNLLEEHVEDRATALERIRTLWQRQRRRVSAAEIDEWIETGR